LPAERIVVAGVGRDRGLPEQLGGDEVAMPLTHIGY
jgi:hypothetical protein